MAPDFAVDVDSFWEHGFTIVRNVYTPQQIDQLRRAVLDSRDHGPGDLLANPGLRQVITDGRLVSIARRILGVEDIVYYGDSSFTIKPGSPGYHKDNADRTDANAPDWRGRYTQLRFGIYLQDHRSHSGGLNVRDRSHNTISLKEGKTVYMRTGLGDVGVWSLRTSHSGGGALLRVPWLPDPEPGERKYPSFLYAKPHGERVSLFIALGADDEHAARYVDYLKTRTYLVNALRASHYDEEALREAEKIGLKVRNLPVEIADDQSIGQNEKWAPIPY